MTQARRGKSDQGAQQQGGAREAASAKAAEKLQKEVEKPLVVKEVKLEKHEIKEKPEFKEHKPEFKEVKNEAKEHKPEFKEHKPEFKEHKPEIKEHKPEFKEGKLEKHEIKEFKVEFEKHPKLEILEKQSPDKLPSKEVAEGPGGQAGDPFAGLSRQALEAHASALEQAAQDVRHFIEESDRPDVGQGALQNEADKPAGT